MEILGQGPMWSSVLSLPRPSLTHHRSVATSRIFPTASFTSIASAQWSHLHGVCWWHAESWTRMAWWRSFSPILAVLSLVLERANGSSAPGLLPTYSHLHVSWCLLYILHAVLGDTADRLATACTKKLHDLSGVCGLYIPLCTITSGKGEM